MVPLLWVPLTHWCDDAELEAGELGLVPDGADGGEERLDVDAVAARCGGLGEDMVILRTGCGGSQAATAAGQGQRGEVLRLALERVAELDLQLDEALGVRERCSGPG